MDPTTVVEGGANVMSSMHVVASSSSFFSEISSNSIAFSDQGQNLAGIFFQASLLPYVVFLYFLSFRGNRVPVLANFGFQFLLLFVFSTIPSGIISKSNYGFSLADVDWLHGGAESLLTITNLLIVLGFTNASTQSEPLSPNKPRLIALGAFAAFIAAMSLGPSLGFEAHSPFLFGLGNLPTDWTSSFPWVTHSEPENALSIPTWAIHSSSVFEWLFAMNLIWNFSKVTDNEKWKGLTWGMFPLHLSGLCACTYHFFYNPAALQFLVSTQAGMTLLGNITLAIAAYRIAKSNGWEVDELNPFTKSSTSVRGIVSDNIAALPLNTIQSSENQMALAIKLSLLTFGAAYLVKYGELGLDLPFIPNPVAAVAIVLAPASIVAWTYYKRSEAEGGSLSFKLPFGVGEDGESKGISMSDVKTYGVAGTVAYILTELAFWAVAFPVASTLLYQTTGHWPDVINDSIDRTAVMGFIFAGANIARLLVPLRLGAALALAPWVDTNIINRRNG